jgi:hypothetical protein
MQEQLHTRRLPPRSSACINPFEGQNKRMSRQGFDGKPAESIRIGKLQCLNAHVIRCALLIPLKRIPNTCLPPAPRSPSSLSSCFRYIKLPPGLTHEKTRCCRSCF